MTKHRYCTGCHQLIPANTTCTNCGRPHGRALQHEHDSRRYRRLRAQALAEQGQCQRCGTTNDLTTHHLTYPARTTADLEVQCRSCHGTTTHGGRPARSAQK